MPSSLPLSVEEKAVKLYAGEGLAPMVRASTTPLRTLALHYGADFVYTEELVDRSITGTIRVENEVMGTIDYVKDTSKLSKKALRKLQADTSASGNCATPLLLRIDRNVERGKLILQIGTGEPELALAAALHVHHEDVDAIDVNMGCPKKFSVSGGMGSALLGDPDRACRIIRTLTDNMTPLGLPVSAKIRLLKDTASTVDFITGLVNAGAKAVAIHARRPGDEAVKSADWDSLRQVVPLIKSKFPTVPILLNGDFYTRQEFVDFWQSTGANGVILARPALYNTSIFRKPVAGTNGGGDNNDYGYQSKLLLDKTVVVQDYLQQAVRYNIHYKNIKYVLCEFMSNRRTPTSRVPFLPQCFPGGQTVAKVCNSQNLTELCKVWNVDYDSVVERQQQERYGNNTLLKHAPPSEQGAAPAGEHKYLDSYFLGDLSTTTTTVGETANSSPSSNGNKIERSNAAKRMRVEESSSAGLYHYRKLWRFAQTLAGCDPFRGTGIEWISHGLHIVVSVALLVSL